LSVGSQARDRRRRLVANRLFVKRKFNRLRYTLEIGGQLKEFIFCPLLQPRHIGISQTPAGYRRLSRRGEINVL
jgi:hypothetical protein